jgi:glycosyltransferase involved in cell wall biosynthesis
MRAGMVLEALSQSYRVSLLVVPAPQYQGFPRELPSTLESLCEQVEMVSHGGDTKQKMQRTAQAYPHRRFDVVHVFRLCAVHYAVPYLNKGRNCPRNHFDIDDIESRTLTRLVELYRKTGNEAKALREAQNIRRLELLETVAFNRFGRIYVCSEADREEILKRTAKIEGVSPDVVVLRNAVRTPARPPRKVFRFLFVGTLSYYPNEDAIRFFCTEILPLIQKQADMSVIVDVAGSQGSGLQDIPSGNVIMVGEVANISLNYEACDAVIVPLRAGGGTRIKVLEAFSYRRPVITTSIGVEGIDAIPNEHVLVADTPQNFAAACLQLMSDPELGERLVENAIVLLQKSHTIKDLIRTVGFTPVVQRLEPAAEADLVRPPLESSNGHSPSKRIERIYVLGAPKDVNFTRCCVASIRYWYPNIRISLVKDGKYDTWDLEKYWNVEIFTIPSKHYGIGMSRLEVLLQRRRERCLIIDSDIVFAGPILGVLEQYGEDFIVEGANYPIQDIKAYYYDPEVVSAMYPPFRFPGYVFNCGQIVATTGIFGREDFTSFIALDEAPPRVLRPDVFVAFEQSVMNFVMHRSEQEGRISIRRHIFMRWPGAMEPSEVEIERITEGDGYDFLVHWAGYKDPVLGKNRMSHVLKYFERFYHQKTART